MMRNRKQVVVSCQLSVVSCRRSSQQRTTDHGPRTCRAQRRGVLLLVVLSMLVLFMLIGTAFLMSSNQYRDAAKQAAKASGAAAFAADYPSLALLLHMDFRLAGQFAVAIDRIIQLVWPWLGVKASRSD